MTDENFSLESENIPNSDGGSQNHFVGPDEKQEEESSRGWMILVLVATFVLIIGGVAVLATVMNLPEANTNPQSFFPFHTVRTSITADNLNPTGQDLVSGITLIEDSTRGWLITFDDRPSFLSWVPMTENDLLSVGFYRGQSTEVPIIILITQNPAEAINQLKGLEGQLNERTPYLAARSNSSTGNFRNVYIENSFTRSNGQITYGLIEQNHLVITGSPNSFRSLLLHARQHLTP